VARAEPDDRAAVGYVVNVQAKTCTCPDQLEGGYTCKHYFAATFTQQRDVLPDGTVIETKTVTLTERKTYKQDWPVGKSLAGPGVPLWLGPSVRGTVFLCLPRPSEAKPR